jgi:SAM-dependent methyltransferase
MTTLSSYESKMTLTGCVTRTIFVPSAEATVYLLSSKASNSSNQLLLCCSGDWRISTSFVAVPDMLEIARFDVRPPPAALDMQQFPPGILCAYPNKATELTVVRAKRVLINFSNVGSLGALDLTEREQKIAQYLADQSSALPKLLSPHHHGHGDSPASPNKVAILDQPNSGLPSNLDRNLFCNIDVYYDVIYGQKSIIDKKVQFIERILAARTRVLDLGCGTGLFAFALRADGIKATCVDASPAMERAVRDKNKFVEDVEGPNSLLKGAPIPFHRADVASFSLTTVDTDGREKYIDFPAVLAIDVLALLPSTEHVQRALENMALHTSREGVAIVSIPNQQFALLTGSTQTAYRRNIDKFTMSVGAAACLPQGVLDVTEQVLLRQLHGLDELHPNNRVAELSDGVPRRSVALIGNAFHQRAVTEGSMFVSFAERFTELLLSCGKFEKLIKAAGFVVEGLYGSMDGSAYVKDTSPHCVYVLKRT